MSCPEISVVIPTCNRPEQLSSCLCALTGQTLPVSLFEVVVVDDGGAAPAAPVTAPFTARLNLHSIRQPNSGPGGARNSGAQLARGRWLAFTDDDCLPAPQWLASLLQAFQTHPDALLGGATFNAIPANPYASASQLIQDFVYTYYNAHPARARFFASNNIALPAAAFRELGGFNHAFRTSEDRDLCDRWRAASRPLISVPAAVVQHAHHLTLASYWRQHFGYGRGARRFHLAHRTRDGHSSLEPGFYMSILRRLPEVLSEHPSPFSAAALLTLWQAANVTGWLLELFQEARSHASR